MMGDGQVSRDWEVWAARQVVRQHTEEYASDLVVDPAKVPMGCRQCSDDGCRMLIWAIHVLKRPRPEIVTQTPTASPARTGITLPGIVANRAPLVSTMDCG